MPERSAQEWFDPEWQRLASLLERIKARGLASLTEQELWELPSLYRKAISDLSLLRSRAQAPGLEQQLNQLCNAAHGVIYAGTQRRRGRGILHYLLVDLPSTAQRRSGLILAASALTAVFAIIGFLHCKVQPDLAETVLGPQFTASYEASLEGAREMKDLKLAAQIDRPERASAWMQITANNVGIGIRALIFGILGGLPAVLILAFNGYMLGAVAFQYFHTVPGIDVNLPLYFIAGIAPHGSLELPAICIAGAAGMLMGFSWLFPGQLPRGAALRAVLPDALRLIAICTISLLIAGLIEGFVTPVNPPLGMPLNLWFGVKIAFGSLMFGMWLLWLNLGSAKSALPPAEA